MLSSDGRAKDETSIRDDEVVAGRVATLESAVCRCKRVHFDYYSILRNEGSTREVEPYMLSLLDGPWYMTGRDVRREDLRQFRRSRIRDRILTVRLTNEHFEQRHGLDLNDKQRQAVEHSGGPLLVLAGPGTGKTGVLVARIEHLVANRGVGPAHILALTFSRRVAANRLWDVEPEKMRLVYVFTHDGSIVAVDNETGFLERAEKRVLDAVERIKGGSFEPIPSKYGCSHCPVMGVGMTGCPMEVPET